MNQMPETSRWSRIQYGALALPLAFAGIPIYIYAPDYYATDGGHSLTVLGFILLALRLLDAVQDPLIGYFSDRYKSKRNSIITASLGLLCFSFITVFLPPFDGAINLVWFGLTIFLATTAYSIIAINLNTLGATWQQGSDQKGADQKTKITSTREIFGLVGLLLAVSLPGALQVSIDKQLSLLITGGVLIIFACIALCLFKRFYRETGHKLDTTKTLRVKSFSLAFLTALSKKQKWFFGTYFLSSLASSIPAVLVLFFIRDRLDLEIFTGLFLLLYFVSAALVMPLWQKLSVKVGRTKTWQIASLLAVISFIFAFQLEADDLVPYIVICIISGSAFGADLMLPPAILADFTEQEQNRDQASLQFGVLAFLLKASLAVASLSSFALVDYFGLQPGGENTRSALQALSVTYALIPCFIKGFAIYLMQTFRKMEI